VRGVTPIGQVCWILKASPASWRHLAAIHGITNHHGESCIIASQRFFFNLKQPVLYIALGLAILRTNKIRATTLVDPGPHNEVVHVHKCCKYDHNDKYQKLQHPKIAFSSAFLGHSAHNSWTIYAQACGINPEQHCLHILIKSVSKSHSCPGREWISNLNQYRSTNAKVLRDFPPCLEGK
jgi:hypothetical protein